MPETKISLTQSELDQKIEIALQKERMDSLTIGFENHEKKEDSYLKEIFDKIRDIQMDVSKSHKELEEEFVSIDIFKVEMKRMETKIDDQWKRITGAVIVAIAVLQFAFKMWGN